MINNIKTTTLSIALAISTLFLATSASAAFTVTIGGTAVAGEGLKSSVAGAVTTDFNANLLNPANYSGGGVVNGSVGGAWASPPNDTSNYFSVGPSTSSPATITFSTLMTYFGYYGGSPDSYNYVDFYNGQNMVASFDGVTLASLASVAANGDQSVGSYWNFTAGNSGDYFNSVVLRSASNAFETDNHAVLAVPEPETYAMMLAGLGLMGFVARRRKNG
ncbi:MAG: FxDxF family PEP-CTERM protein [Methylotenera sp.]|nr:FxDxF family PEP-CTERM protein [Methylotenera sp.]